MITQRVLLLFIKLTWSTSAELEEISFPSGGYRTIGQRQVRYSVTVTEWADVHHPEISSVLLVQGRYTATY